MFRLSGGKTKSVRRPGSSGRKPSVGGRRVGYTAEDKLQHAIVHALSVAMTQGVVYHINNSGTTDAERVRHAYLGVVPGVADLHVIWKKGHGFIEVKTPRGKQSSKQKDFEKLCKDLKVPYELCRSVDDALAFLKKHKVPHRLAK